MQILYAACGLEFNGIGLPSSIRYCLVQPRCDCRILIWMPGYSSRHRQTVCLALRSFDEVCLVGSMLADFEVGSLICVTCTSGNAGCLIEEEAVCYEHQSSSVGQHSRAKMQSAQSTLGSTVVRHRVTQNAAAERDDSTFRIQPVLRPAWALHRPSESCCNGCTVGMTNCNRVRGDTPRPAVRSSPNHLLQSVLSRGHVLGTVDGAVGNRADQRARV